MPAGIHPPYSVYGNAITLHCTDGNPAFRPTNGELIPIRLEDGSIDYMHECTGDDPTLQAWKVKIGTFLAVWVLNLPPRQKYFLSSLPQGYSLFVHKKGDRFNPRCDAYLRGSYTVTVFRSPAEFFFHAKWILLGCPKPRPQPSYLHEELFGPPLPEEYTDRCGCTYCSGVSQTYISTNFSHYHPKKRRGTKVETQIRARFEGIRS
ncbi:hypothetical protein K439DRAFT_454879 [Ramaria rubella]|nr:hypothetical protein K439DRAFT_454879 [Ramaria rubella]